MLTDRQRATYQFIIEFHGKYGYSPKLNEIAEGIGIQSKGVIHRYLQAIAADGLIELLPGRHRGIRLNRSDIDADLGESTLPLLGKISAGRPIEAIPGHDSINLADFFMGPNRYVLKVQGDSMIEAGILDGDVVIITQRNHASNGDIVVALIDREEATLKRIKNNQDDSITLIPANSSMQAITYHADRILIQGVVVGQMRSYGSGRVRPR